MIWKWMKISKWDGRMKLRNDIIEYPKDEALIM